MDALRLALILTVMVIAVLAATRPAPNRRPRRTPERGRERRAGNDLTKHRLLAGRGLAIQRNRWDRADLERAIGRDYDDVDGSLSTWPGV